MKAGRVADVWRLGSWNVRTLRGDGKIELLARALRRERVDICGLCETRWQDEEERVVEDPESRDRYRIWIGPAERGQGGVGVAVREKISDSMESWEALSA